MSIISSQDVFENIQHVMSDVVHDLTDAIHFRITTNMELDGNFSVSGFFKNHAVPLSGKNLFFSTYQLEILSRVAARLRMQGFNCHIEYDEENKKIFYETRVERMMNRILKNVTYLSIASAALYALYQRKFANDSMYSI